MEREGEEEREIKTKNGKGENKESIYTLHSHSGSCGL